MNKIIYNLGILQSIINRLFNQQKQLFNADFADISKLKVLMSEMLPEEDNILIGKDNFGHMLRVRPTRGRRELGNALIVAPTRGGKGLLATSQLLTWPHSVVVNDIKGDLFTQTAGYRSKLGDVYVIDPTGVGHTRKQKTRRLEPFPGCPGRYDPLEGKETEDELLSSAAHLLFKADEGEGAIFTQRATVMLTQLFLAAREEGQAPFPYVRHMVRSGLTSAVERLEAVSPELATQFLDVEPSQANLSDRFLLSAWGTLSARIRPLLTETVIRSLAGSDFSASELMQGKKPVTVYLRWPERDLLALSPLVRLLWGSLIDELITTYGASGQNCHPVLLLVDEAGVRPFHALQITPRRSLAGEFPSGLPSKPYRSWKPSTGAPEPVRFAITWKPRSTIVLPISRLQNTSSGVWESDPVSQAPRPQGRGATAPKAYPSRPSPL